MIDSHHHFWNFNEEEFGWIEDESIRRSFNVPELEGALSGTGVDGVVSVQARCSLEENDYLLAQAEVSTAAKGIVGWVDFKAPDVRETLAQLSKMPAIKGMREIIQGSADEVFLTNSAFNHGLQSLSEFGLSYDLLIFENQLESAHQFVRQHADLPMVLDHCAKPSIRQTEFPVAWEKGIRQIAQNENLCCKLSGLGSEIRDASACTPDLLRPYFDVVLDAFGPDRIMFGSDWPVSLTASSYRHWLDTVHQLLSELTQTEQAAILTTTATRFYRL